MADPTRQGNHHNRRGDKGSLTRVKRVKVLKNGRAIITGLPAPQDMIDTLGAIEDAWNSRTMQMVLLAVAACRLKHSDTILEAGEKLLTTFAISDVTDMLKTHGVITQFDTDKKQWAIVIAANPKEEIDEPT